MNLQEFLAVNNQLARMVQESEVSPENVFPFAIAKMNEMYTLPINVEPTLDPEELGETPLKRMQGYMKTLQKEVNEGNDIIAILQHRDEVEQYISTSAGSADREAELLEFQIKHKMVDEAETEPLLDLDEIDQFILVSLADWFGDKTVYIRSEAMKFGIPLEAVQYIIMASNFTKLNPDGSVTKDSAGKVQKGPNFRPPEEAIKALLFQKDELMEEHIQNEKEVERARALAIPALLTDAVPEEFYGEDYEEEDDEEGDDE